MNDRPEIIDEAAVIEAWLKPEDGRDDSPYKDRLNHASKIGHPCDRYLVLRRTHGDHAAPPSQRLKAIFKRGRVLEQPVAVKQLIAAGWRIWDEQKRFDIVEKGEVLLTAAIDCVAKPPGSENVYVVDHKIVNPYDWEKIPRGWDGYEYLKASEKSWLRAWPAQVTSYMYAKPGVAETGLLQLVAADTLLPKFVYVPWDAEYCQWILDRAAMLNERTKAVLAKGMSELPAPVEWSESLCGRCELLGICLPDQTGRTPLQLIEDDDFTELVALDRELSAQKGALDKKFKDVHDRVKHAVGDIPELVVGDYWITQKQYSIKEFTVKAREETRLYIKPLKKAETDEAEVA